MILLDTDVLIDCLRGLPSADEWLRESSGQGFGIPGIVAPDCIVAAMALERSVPLYTFNLKHYQSFPGLEVLEPYTR